MTNIWRNVRNALSGGRYNWLDFAVVGGAALGGILWTLFHEGHFRGSLMQLVVGAVILAYAAIRNHLSSRARPKRKPLEKLQNWHGRDGL